MSVTQRPAPEPQLVSWNLTRVCNLACGHCYLDAVQRRSEASDELTSEEALAVVEDIAALAPGAMLVLTGGEPLMRRDLDQLIACAAAHGLMPVIGSNGSLLNAARARRLREVGAVGVGISLDSILPGFHDRLRGMAGAWGKTVAGIDAARAAGLAVQLQMSVFAENRHELAAMADYAEEIGALALNVFFLVCTGRGVSQTDLDSATYEATLAEIAALQRERPHLMLRARCAPYMRRRLGLHVGEARDGYESFSSACLAGRSYFRIGPAGDVTPCPYIPDAIGNLRQQRLGELWRESPVLQRLREEMPGGKCGHCDYRISCGGCRARALALAGDLMAEDPRCAYLPPTGALPESPAEHPAVGAAPTWDTAASGLLAQLPGFIRRRVREGVERRAQEAGIGLVTLAFMQACRPAALSLRRPGAKT
ncbi:MAG: radical SAM protein [Rhodoferax sp.]